MHQIMEATKAAIEEAAKDMTPEQLAWHPEGKWSACEVLEHLSLAFSGTVKVLNRVYESGKPDYTRKSLFQMVGTGLVAGLGIFPGGRTAPAMVTPKGADACKIVDEILGNLTAMDEAISKCEEKFGTTQKIANHPVLGALNVQQWRKFHCAHTRHHMKQIHRLRIMQKIA